MDKQFVTHEDLTGHVQKVILATESHAGKGSRTLQMNISFEVSPLVGLRPAIQYVISVGGQVKRRLNNLEHAIREYNTTMCG